jgi:autotransporter-associated beta strand protein
MRAVSSLCGEASSLPARKASPRRGRAALLKAAASAAGLMAITRTSLAASETWTAISAGNWGTASNWSNSTLPGGNGTTTSTDTAAFNNATGVVVTIDATAQNIGNITFASGAGGYTIGGLGANAGNSLFLTSGGVITDSLAGTTTETINAPLVLEGGYTFLQNDTNNAGLLNIGGNISGAAGAVTLTLNGTDTGNNTISGNISNGSASSVGITKAGAGTWVVSGVNSYSGNTTIDGGNLTFSTGQSLTSATNNLIFGTTAGDTNVGTLNVSGNTTFGGTLAVQTNSTGNNTISVANNQTLSIDGNVAVSSGATGATNTTNLVVTGASGTLIVTKGNGTFVVGNGVDTSIDTVTADFSQLGTLTINLGNSSSGTGVFDFGNGNNSSVTTTNTMKFASTTTITAANFDVGYGPNNTTEGQSNAGNSTLTLGATTTINANTIVIGAMGGSSAGRGGGVVQFGGGGGNLTIDGAPGGATTANIYIAYANASTAATVMNSSLNLAGSGSGTNVQIGNLTMGAKDGQANLTANMTFGNGTLSIGNLTMAQVSAGNPAGNTTVTATLTLNAGGTVYLGNNTGTIILGIDNLSTSGSGGSGNNSTAIPTLTINGATVTSNASSFILTDRTGTNGNITSALNISAGTLTLNSNITTVGLTTGSTSTLTLNGGTLNMGGYNIGAGTSATAITTSFQSGTLENVGEIDGGSTAGASLTKTTNGALALLGNSTYTAATAINAGTLVLGSSGSVSSLGNTAITIAGNTTFLAKGTDSIGSGSGASITSNGGTTTATQGTISLVDGTINTLTLNGNLSLGTGSNGSILSFEITGNGTAYSSDQLAVNGTATENGVNIINVKELTGATITVGNYTLITASSGNLSGGFTLGTTPGGGYSYTLANSNADDEILTIGQYTGPSGAVYWTGNASTINSDLPNNWGNTANSGNTTNWSTDLPGHNDPGEVPGASSDVYFTAENTTPSSGNNLVTQLDAAYAIKGLYFDTSQNGNLSGGSVQINTNGNSLTIGADGLTVLPNDNSTTSISGNGLVIIGGNEAWANNATAAESLSVSVPTSASLGATTLTFNGNGTGGVTLSGAISDGSGVLAIVFNQAGTTVLGGANSYSGGTTLSSGTVQLSGAGTLGATTGALTVNGGTLDLNGTSQTVGALSGSGGTILNNGNSTSTLTASASGNSTFAGTLANGSGTLAVTQAGNGTLTFTGPNSYTGTTSVINSGTIQVNAGGTLGATTDLVTLGTGAPGTIGTIGNLVINTNTTIGGLSVVSNTSNLTSLSNTNQLTIASGSTLTVGGNVAIGVFTSTTSNTLTALGTGSVAGAGGNLTVNGSFAVSAGGNNSGIGNATANLSGLSNFNQTATSGFLNVGFGMSATGNLTLAPNNAINVGQINVGNSNGLNSVNNASLLTLGTGSTSLEANTIDVGVSKAGGIVQLPAGATVSIAGTNGSGGANISVGQATTGTYDFSGTDGLYLAGGTATVSAGTVTVGYRSGSSAATGNLTTGAITFDTGTFTATNLELAPDTSGNGTNPLTMVGSFTLGTNSSSTGSLTVNTNFFLADDTNGNSGALNDTANGTFTLNGGNATINTNITVPSTHGTSNTTLTLNGGTLNMTGHFIGGNGSNGNQAITTLNFQSGTLENVLQINNGAPLVKSGNGTLILAGVNSYTGATTVSAGTLTAGSTSAFGINSAVTLVNASGVLLNLNNFNNSIGSLTGGGADGGNVSLGSATLTIGTDNTSPAAYAGIISGTGGITKTGSGALTVTGANAYSGTTTLSAGMLFANSATSALGSGEVTINGGMLAGGGTISNGSNAITVNASGVIGAGATASTVGKLTTGDQVWNGNASFAVKMTGAGGNAGTVTPGSGGSGMLGGGNGTEGADWDNLVMGNLTVGSSPSSPFTIALSGNSTGAAASTQYSWVIAQTGSSTLPTNIQGTDNLLAGGAGPDAGLFTLDTTNFTFDGTTNPFSSYPNSFSLEFEQVSGSDGNYDLVLDYASAPEPASGLLVLAGGLPMLMARRRRRARQ